MLGKTNPIDSDPIRRSYNPKIVLFLQVILFGSVCKETILNINSINYFKLNFKYP